MGEVYSLLRIVHGGSRRVDPSNDVSTERRYGKMDGVDEGKEGAATL